MKHVSSICLIERFLLMKLSTLFDQHQNLFEFMQKEHQPNATHCKMMEHDRWVKHFATCNTVKRFKN